jgi:uncharacterized membrane protein YphA (DoxX/SURF4 family)
MPAAEFGGQTMRSDRPLVLAVIFLAAGLGVLFGYCNGTTGFSASYPFTGSILHLEMTTTGVGVMGGLVATAIGLLLMVWAFLAAIVSLFTGPAVSRERVVERVSVVPRETPAEYAAEDAPVQRRHFWSRSTQGTNL